MIHKIRHSSVVLTYIHISRLVGLPILRVSQTTGTTFQAQKPIRAGRCTTCVIYTCTVRSIYTYIPPGVESHV